MSKAENYKAQYDYNQRKKEQGYVKPAIWVHKSKRDDLVRYAHQLNSLAENQEIKQDTE